MTTPQLTPQIDGGHVFYKDPGMQTVVLPGGSVETDTIDEQSVTEAIDKAGGNQHGQVRGDGTEYVSGHAGAHAGTKHALYSVALQERTGKNQGDHYRHRIHGVRHTAQEQHGIRQFHGLIQLP